jgi:hypothetical protein
LKPPLGRSGGGRKGRGAALCAQALGLGWIGEVALVGGRRLAPRTAVALELGDVGLKFSKASTRSNN